MPLISLLVHCGYRATKSESSARFGERARRNAQRLRQNEGLRDRRRVLDRHSRIVSRLIETASCQVAIAQSAN
jgi:hypothetical protein